MDYFTSSLHHIIAELEWIDLIIQAHVSQVRHANKDNDEFRGLYISDKEIDLLLTKPIGSPRWINFQTPLSFPEFRSKLDGIKKEIEAKKLESKRHGLLLRLDKLSKLFQLDNFETNVLLICFAPEVDVGYERIYAYLQDDITKKWPSVDLTLNILSSSLENKIQSRNYFCSSSPLLQNSLINLLSDPSNPNQSVLSKHVKIDERIAGYLLDSNEVDSNLSDFIRIVEPNIKIEELFLSDEDKNRLGILIQNIGSQFNNLVFYLHGSFGVGKQTCAEAICNSLGVNLITVDLEDLIDFKYEEFKSKLSLVIRESKLQNAIIFWSNFDLILNEEKRILLKVFLDSLKKIDELVFLSGNTIWEPTDFSEKQYFLRMGITRPNYLNRVKMWNKSLNHGIKLDESLDIVSLANKFKLSYGQIKDAASTAKNLAAWRGPGNIEININDLYDACRLQSNQKLSTLAKKVIPSYKWNDIVLPEDSLNQLKEICNYVKFRVQVYDNWGFDKKLSMGKGLNVLFAGPSGTGKTMAAEIVANQLKLDLYKIDLSNVVSKYIGETEKNLARIFEEAETANSILFFDEADALFGKRTEVRDSHDRYANIEVNYLLQKMEEYEGIVILATNFRKNMDDAFVRRMHFTVEFALPGEKDRLKIWEQIWPKETPKDSKLDLGFVAKRFEISGGNIKNIALAAAFFAAADNGNVKMNHLINATRREYQKMGKVIAEGEFGKYTEKYFM